MDAGDMTAAMGGFFLGQMFAERAQATPALLHFASIRVDRKEDILDTLGEVLKDAFFKIAQETELDFEFTNKGEMKVWRKNRGMMEQPLIVFGLCTVSWTKKRLHSHSGTQKRSWCTISTKHGSSQTHAKKSRCQESEIRNLVTR